MTFSPDGKLLAVIYSTGIYLYDAETLAEVKFIATDFKIYSVAFSPDGLTLATGTVNNLVYLWAISDGGSSSALTGPRNSSNPTLISVKFSPDGQTIAAGSEGGIYKFGNYRTIRFYIH